MMTFRARHGSPRGFTNTKPAGFTNTKPAGFTLTELMVVVVIMILLFSIAVPSLRGMMDGAGQTASTANATAAAAGLIRSFAGTYPIFAQGTYSGLAMLITPDNQIRYLQEVDPSLLKDDACAPFNVTLDAYQSLPGINPLPLPSGVGVVGLSRGGTAAAPVTYVLTAPVAIRFNPEGNLVSRRTTEGILYYNGNYDVCTSAVEQKYTSTRGRDNPWWKSGAFYNPDDWDTNSPTYVPNPDGATTANDPGMHAVVGNDQGRQRLPFDRYESVIGLMVFSKSQLRQAGLTLASVTGSIGELNAAAATWILDNGTPIFFNRYTGTALRR